MWNGDPFAGFGGAADAFTAPPIDEVAARIDAFRVALLENFTVFAADESLVALLRVGVGFRLGGQPSIAKHALFASSSPLWWLAHHYALDQAERVRLLALVIAYCARDDDRFHELRDLFLRQQLTSATIPFPLFRDALELGGRFAARKRGATVLALCRLFECGRIEAVHEHSSVVMFVRMFLALPRDVRCNLLLPACVNFCCAHDTNPAVQHAVCKDTVNVWMRCAVKRDTSMPAPQNMFVHYLNWSERWDEWLDPNDASRVAPWVEPCQKTSILRVHDVQVARTELEIMDLLRMGQVGSWQFCDTFV